MTDLVIEQMIVNQTECEYLDKSKSALTEFTNLESTLKLVGENGRYQRLLLLSCCLVSFSLGINFIATPFLFYQPTFLCYDESLNFKECTQKEACPNQFGYTTKCEKISLTSTYKIYCENAYMEKYAKSLLFISVAFSVISFSSVADRIGRRTVLRILACMLLVSTFGILTFQSFEGIWISYCLSYACGSSYFCVSSIYFSEIMGILKRKTS